MQKIKPKKAVVKRVKVTARGKMLRWRVGSGHLKSRKSPKRLRRFRKSVAIPKSFERQTRQLLGI